MVQTLAHEGARLCQKELYSALFIGLNWESKLTTEMLEFF